MFEVGDVFFDEVIFGFGEVGAFIFEVEESIGGLIEDVEFDVFGLGLAFFVLVEHLLFVGEHVGYGIAFCAFVMFQSFAL